MQTTYTLEKERIIGCNVLHLIQEKNITVAQLAEMVGCSEMHIQAIITGSIDIETEEVERLAQALAVPKEKIMEEVCDEVMQEYNIHCMGNVTNQSAMNKTLNKVDLYVRLLNIQTER